MLKQKKINDLPRSFQSTVWVLELREGKMGRAGGYLNKTHTTLCILLSWVLPKVKWGHGGGDSSHLLKLEDEFSWSCTEWSSTPWCLWIEDLALSFWMRKYSKKRSWIWFKNEELPIPSQPCYPSKDGKIFAPCWCVKLEFGPCISMWWYLF